MIRPGKQITLAALALALSLGASVAMAQEPVPAPDQQAPGQETQQELAMVQGELLRVDTERQMLWIEGADDKEIAFRYTADTEVIGGAQNVEGLATRSGTQVTVEFRVDGSDAVATRIAIHAQDEASLEPTPAP